MVTEISKNESSSNNHQQQHHQCNRKTTSTSTIRNQHGEQDYRYSLLNAMSSVKSSYFKCSSVDYNNLCDDSNNFDVKFIGNEDDQLLDWFRKVKNKVDEAVKVTLASFKILCKIFNIRDIGKLGLIE